MSCELPIAFASRRGRALAALFAALASASSSYAALPLHFEPNVGQFAPAARFVARGDDGTLFFLPGETVLALRARDGVATLRLRWLGARADAPIVGEDPLAGRVNVFRGSDPTRWRSDIPTFARVRYTDLYPGIDVAYYASAGDVEHDLLVAPGADATQARIEIAGADSVARDARGDLVIALAGRSVRLRAPVSHQERDGERRAVASRWVLDAPHRAHIAVGDYDRSRPLVIDPVLTYSTYFGGNAEDNGGGIHVDASGITFGGNTVSTDLPAPGGAQTTNGGGFDAFVAKLDPTGASLVYATYYGGSGDDTERDLAVDGDGNAYIFGETTSTDLPTTDGALDRSCGSDGLCDGGTPDTFVAKISANGAQLGFATYLGGSGSDIAGKIAVDATAHAYVAGYTNSVDLPATPGAFDSTCGTDGACNSVKRDCFVAKLDADGASLAYLTYLGGSAFDRCFGVDVDASGRAVVVGSTFSADFPATPGAYDTSCGSDGLCDGADDAFAAMLDADGAKLVYATFLGGSGDGDGEIDEYGWAVDVDATGRAWIVGQTDSTDFPTPNGARHDYGGGALDAFVAQLDPTGATLVYGTYLGGSGADEGLGIAVDSSGNANVVGATDSSDFPLVHALTGPGNACDYCTQGFTEGFVATIDASGGGLAFSSFLGGTSSDYAANVAVFERALYALGDSYSTDFPTQSPLQAAHGAGANYDAFVARIAVPEPSAALLSLASIAALARLAARTDRRAVPRSSS